MRDTAFDQTTGWVGSGHPYYVPGMGDTAVLVPTKAPARLSQNAAAQVQEAMADPGRREAAERIAKASDPHAAAREQLRKDIEAAHAGQRAEVFSRQAERAARRARGAENGVYNALPGKRTGWSKHVAAMIARGGSHAEQVALFTKIATESADATDMPALSGLGESEIDPESIVTAEQALPAATAALAIVGKAIEAEALAEIAGTPPPPPPTATQKAAAWSLPLVALGIVAVMVLGQKSFK